MTLPELRSQVDGINRQIVSLLGKRLDVCKEIARLKKIQGLPLLDPERESAVIGSVREWARGHSLNPAIVEEIFAILLDYTRLEMELAP